MTDAPRHRRPAIPGLEDMQQWTLVMGRAQQMLMEAWADNLAKGSAMPGLGLGDRAGQRRPDGSG